MAKGMVCCAGIATSDSRTHLCGARRGMCVRGAHVRVTHRARVAAAHMSRPSAAGIPPSPARLQKCNGACAIDKYRDLAEDGRFGVVPNSLQ